MPLCADRKSWVLRNSLSRSVSVSLAVFLLVACSGGSPIAAERPAAAAARPAPEAGDLEQELQVGPPTPGVVYRLGDAGTAGVARSVVLTFDDGPNPRDTPRILAILARFRVHAVFCQVGSMAAAHPALARAEVLAGNVVCDHTHAHLHRLATRPPDVINSEVNQGLTEVTAASGTRPMIFRSPEGSLSPTVIDTAHRYGLAVWQWTVDPKDYTRPTPQVLVSRVLDHISPGAVVLLHDGGGNRDNTATALPAILAGLLQRGYQLTLP